MATTHELIDRAVRLASHEGCTNGFVATTCREAQEPIQEYCTGCLLELIAKHLEDATDCAALRQQIAALRDKWRDYAKLSHLPAIERSTWNWAADQLADRLADPPSPASTETDK
jgi:hypothetical protein